MDCGEEGGAADTKVLPGQEGGKEGGCSRGQQARGAAAREVGEEIIKRVSFRNAH